MLHHRPLHEPGLLRAHSLVGAGDPPQDVREARHVPRRLGLHAIERGDDAADGLGLRPGAARRRVVAQPEEAQERHPPTMQLQGPAGNQPVA